MPRSEKQKGGFGWIAGGRAGRGLNGPGGGPRQPRESLLVDAINYGETYQMPPKSKLPAEEIATLTHWVAQGLAVGRGRAKAADHPARQASREH